MKRYQMVTMSGVLLLVFLCGCSSTFSNYPAYLRPFKDLQSCKKTEFNLPKKGSMLERVAQMQIRFCRPGATRGYIIVNGRAKRSKRIIKWHPNGQLSRSINYLEYLRKLEPYRTSKRGLRVSAILNCEPSQA